jgi:hypothetical protein
MVDQKATEATFHALLIGIDNYPGHELKGCVNDIDALQRVLVGPRMRIPKDQIRCLVSPLPGAQRKALDGEQAANAVNLRRELEALGSKQVAAGDRVFIYYSGHGKRITVNAGDGSTFCREALVPADFETAEPGFLFDFELDRLLHKIVEQTRSVTVILDCCHSGGVTREVAREADDSAVRALDEDTRPVPDPAGHAGTPVDRAADAKNFGADACQTVSACLAYEFAKESNQDGVRHGLLTRSFLTALEAVPDTDDLRALTWAQIWRGMAAEVMRQNPLQTPWLDGYLGRAVFAGPPIHGDPGIPVVRDGDRYQIWAGEIAEITKGVELAVYGDLPEYFPPLGSPKDRPAGVIRVSEATESDAVASPVGAPFPISPGARGRIVKAEKLPCAVIPPDQDIVQALGESPLIKPVAPGEAASVRVELRDGRWYLIDDAPVRVELPSGNAAVVRDVLEHYHRYSLPLRVARRAAAACKDGLELRLLSCPDGPDFDPAKADVSKLSDAPPGPDGIYRVPNGAPVCMYVCNRTDQRLQVTLFDVGGEGEVDQLSDQVIEPKGSHVFWRFGNEPYRMWLADGVQCARDRLVVIGRTSRYPLDYLRVDETFADVLARSRGDDRRAGGSTGSTSSGGPAKLWTADQKVVEIWRA